MGHIIEKHIPQKDLDLEFNSAKIIASPYDYKLSKRLILRTNEECCYYFNIFNKSNYAEKYLANLLSLDVKQSYLQLHPSIPISPTLPSVKSFEENVLLFEKYLGMCGFFVEYNNLNIDENTLIADLYTFSSRITDLKNKNYLKALEVLHLKCITSSSLIPNLMYLTTEFANKDLNYLENLKFAEEACANGVAPILKSFRRFDIEDENNPVKASALLSTSLFLLSKPSLRNYSSYPFSKNLKDIPNEFYRLGLIYSLIYGAELLYYFNSITDSILRYALEELFAVGYQKNTFCSKYLYQIDDLGRVVINSDIQKCFIADNEKRFEEIKKVYNNLLISSDLSKDIYKCYDEFTLPLFFMRMIGSMHSYAYQVSRIKHATFLYAKAKDLGLLNKKDFDEECSSEGGLFFTDFDEDTGESFNNELLNLNTFSTTDDSDSSLEDSIEKEKSITKKQKDNPIALNSMDALKQDLHNSPYDYDISYVKSDISNKESYNIIAKNIKLITNNLTRQIKEIKTYNSGGKQNGLLVGKLDRKNLYKYKTDPHIFYNNNYKLKEMDLAFGCILDESGSMHGEKVKNGRIVMIMLHEVLNSLGINHSIIGHTSNGYHQTKIFKYYQFKEESHYTLEKPYSLVKATSRNGNCDSGALYYMQSSMRQVRNKDKIVIIFSDGQPTECTDNELVKQVENMERNGIHVIGVGINFDSIKEYYSDNANGKNLKEMVDIVVSILKRYVLEKKE